MCLRLWDTIKAVALFVVRVQQTTFHVAVLAQRTLVSMCTLVREVVNEENELWGWARVPKESCTIPWKSRFRRGYAQVQKRILHNLTQSSTFHTCTCRSFLWNVQDSKIIVKDSLIFSQFSSTFLTTRSLRLTLLRRLFVRSRLPLSTVFFSSN